MSDIGTAFAFSQISLHSVGHREVFCIIAYASIKHHHYYIKLRHRVKYTCHSPANPSMTSTISSMTFSPSQSACTQSHTFHNIPPSVSSPIPPPTCPNLLKHVRPEWQNGSPPSRYLHPQPEAKPHLKRARFDGTLAPIVLPDPLLLKRQG